MENESIKIAIVDDHHLIRHALKVIFDLQGFKVIIEACNGQSLIDEVGKSAILPDVCIVDGNMPTMNGVQTTEILKAKWNSIKIIGYSSDERLKNAMIEKGADEFLLKSCDLNQIIESIRHMSVGTVYSGNKT